MPTRSLRDTTPGFFWQQHRSGRITTMATLGTARPAAWTEAEQKQLETLARRYPSSEHSLVTQCAKIAAGLPRKSIRDVGARLRLLALDPLATAQPARPGTARHAALEKQCRELLQQNVAVVSEMRENLHKIQLMDNIPLMRRFDANVRATFGTRGPGIRGTDDLLSPRGEHDVRGRRRLSRRRRRSRDGPQKKEQA